MRLTLLVPDLIWPEPDDQLTLGKLALPGLEWLLAHASADKTPRRAFENVVAEHCGLATPNLAPLRLLGEGGEQARTGYWLCADPVHLRFHHERIVLADAGAFDLDEEEARQLADSLNACFADIGHFHVANSRRWYLQLHHPVTHAVAPLSAVAGRRMDSELPSGDPTLSRWLNEVQMFLHGHPINAQRQQQGKPAINSLWLWGGGCLPEKLSPAFSDLWSDHPLAKGLASVAGLPRHDRPASLSDVLQNGGPTPLVILDQLLSPVLYEDGQGWRQTIEHLDTDWFSPLKKALGRQIKTIHLIAPTVYGALDYRLSASERWKFWKQSQPLALLARQLADPS